MWVRIMANKSVSSIYNEALKDGSLRCTQAELDEFLNLGFIFKNGNSFVDRQFRAIHIDIVENTNYRMNINLSQLIGMSKSLLEEQKITNKIYYMTNKTYLKIKNQNLIIIHKDIEYYRLFENELWLVHII